MANKTYIKDSKNFERGWCEEDAREKRYYGYSKGYIGRYDKNANMWFWMSGPRVGQMGPRGDIGYGEVLQAEGAY